jgi:hypothetical protein
LQDGEEILADGDVVIRHRTDLAVPDAAGGVSVNERSRRSLPL